MVQCGRCASLALALCIAAALAIAMDSICHDHAVKIIDVMSVCYAMHTYRYTTVAPCKLCGVPMAES